VARAFARVITFVRLTFVYGFGETAMDFQVNEQTYFLSLAEDDKRWLFFVSTPTGAVSIPVYEDAAEGRPLVVLQEEKHRVPN
jgi:hypothetical protein